MSETHSKCFICEEEKVKGNSFDKFLSLGICSDCRKKINDEMRKEVLSINMGGDRVSHIHNKKEVKYYEQKVVQENI